jgi:hypothetical protein
MTPPDERADLPPEQDAVRRLLAEARHDEPVPPAVAARLDAVLADLTAERRESPATAPVVELGTRRRRRVGAALLAAAAVVVGGIGVGQVVSGTGGSSSDSGAASTADRGAADRSSPESSDGGGAGALSSPDPDVRRAPGGLPAAYRLSSDSLRRDLLAARRAEELATLAGESAVPDDTTPDQDAAADSPCDPASLPDTGDGTVVPVTLDGQPALALYDAPAGERQRVAVYLCGASAPERSLTLPAP